MGLFDRFKKIMKEGAPSAARLAEDVAAARTMEGETRAELDRLQALRVTLLDADDAAQQKNRNSINDARDRLEDLSLYVSELGKRHAVAEAAEARQTALDNYNAARKQVEAAAKVLAKDYGQACKKLLAVVQTVAKAQAVADAVNVALPDGADFIYPVMPASLATKLHLPSLAEFGVAYFEPERPFYDGMTGTHNGQPRAVLAIIEAGLAIPAE